MFINENGLEELDESQLEQISGGSDNTEFLDESNVPRHWIVTCTGCSEQFTVYTNKRCPFCGNTEVRLDYSSSRPYFDCQTGKWN